MFKRVTAYPLVLVAILGNTLKIHSLSIDQESAKSRKVGEFVQNLTFIVLTSSLGLHDTARVFFPNTHGTFILFFCAKQSILIQILLTSRSYIYVIYICMYINMFLFTVHLKSLNAHLMFPLFRENQKSISFFFFSGKKKKKTNKHTFQKPPVFSKLTN